MVGLLRALLAGGVAAGVGAVVWVLIAQSTGLQIHLLALPIAALVGFAVAFGAQGDANDLTGLLALLLTAASVFFGFSLSADAVERYRQEEATAQVNEWYPEFDEEVLVSYIADQVVEDWAGGRAINWPAHVDEDTGVWYEHDYPADVWAEAEARYAFYSEAEQADLYAAFEAQHERYKQEDYERLAGEAQDEDEFRSNVRVRRRGLGLFSVGFWLLSAGAAWGIGRGGWDND